jgi:hypothetical protein
MLSLTEGVERRSDRMAEVSRGHSSCLFGAKGRTCYERIEGHVTDWLDRSLASGLAEEVEAGSPDGYNKCPETSRRMVNETKLTPATEDRNRPLRNRTAGGVGGRRERSRLLTDREAFLGALSSDGRSWARCFTGIIGESHWTACQMDVTVHRGYSL